MAYVRWSSDGHRSAVYAYEHCDGGFALHIASRKRIGLDGIPEHPPLDEIGDDPESWRRRYNEHKEALDALSFADIDHPDAGQTFHFDSLRELRDQLAAYREEGVLHVPDWVVPMLEEEIAEGRGDGG